MWQTLARLPRPIHAVLNLKTKLYGSFTNIKLYVCSLLHNQNRPELHYISVLFTIDRLQSLAYRAGRCRRKAGGKELFDLIGELFSLEERKGSWYAQNPAVRHWYLCCTHNVHERIVFAEMG
jgi:hypothetical protein